MGYHLYFYKKIEDFDYDTVKSTVVDLLRKEIKFTNLNNGLNNKDKEWTTSVINRQIRVIKKGLCKLATHHRFELESRIIIYNENDSSFYEECVNEFFWLRVNYTDKVFRSKKDILEYIENTCGIVLSDENHKLLNDFWIKYENGIIKIN